ncbi:MAG: cytochrome b/b6 domain-containing protein [Zoogloeaceae bacterium]|jgi:cytochrome b|nr:cytochrome b/b6 domain-containing protein [Zoogloeaceae bacterium]
MQKIKVWDLPTRLFHWLLVVAMAGLFFTGLEGGGWIEWHGKIGLAVIGLVVFRIVWGFCGSTYARFFQFFPTPKGILAYLKGQWHGEGHNPLGALSVFALLTLSLLQAGTGLFTDDQIAFTGPFAKLIDSDLSVSITGIHKQLAWVLLAFVGLHVLSIVFYRVVQKHNLLTAMITGTRLSDAPSAQGGGIVAFLVALILAAAAVFGATGLWLPEPPPPPPVETPAW